MSHSVFDIVPEDPEKQAVAQQVQPSAVQKHRNERREQVDRIVIDDARHPVAERNAGAQARQVRDLTRYEAQIADARCELDFVYPGPLNEDPDAYESRQDQICHDRRPLSLELVAKRYHFVPKMRRFGRKLRPRPCL
jgi:hypothetical protein